MGTIELKLLQFWGSINKTISQFSASDPGFPRGGAPALQERAPTYNFVKFSQKLHKIEIISTRKGAHPKSVTETAV